MRSVLSHYPTGVVVVTAKLDGGPVGLAVGSFTSISLEPPFVGFFADRGSTTFPEILQAGVFCVNVLSAEDARLCQQFSARGVDRFAGLDWRESPLGSPILEGVVAWIDCIMEDTIEVGDHFLAVGRVHALEASRETSPVVFHRGSYRQLRE